MGSIACVDVFEDANLRRPYLFVLSSSDEHKLVSACDGLCDRLMRDDTELSDEALDVSAQRLHGSHRAYVVTRDPDISLEDFTMSPVGNNLTTKICLLFTGQGAQWPQMGRDLLQTFTLAQAVIRELDEALRQIDEPPEWSIISELMEPRTREEYCRPVIAQTLTTAIQIAIVAIYRSWGLKVHTVIGHSFGEVAAACAAGLLSPREAIITAYYCGWAVGNPESRPPFDTGMLAVAKDAGGMQKLLQGRAAEHVRIACYNGPRALTLSGPRKSLEMLRLILKEQGTQTSLLSCPVAYHHPGLMGPASRLYESKLNEVLPAKKSHNPNMLSTVTTEPMKGAADAAYWRRNILQPVRFEETLNKALSAADAPTVLIEVGPAGSLAGAVMDIKARLGAKGDHIKYYKSMNRGRASIAPMFQVAGGLLLAGDDIDVGMVNS